MGDVLPVQLHSNSETFSPYALLDAYEKTLRTREAGAIGAAAHFIGTMRAHNQRDLVMSMTLEHYPGMTESQLHNLRQQLIEEYRLIDCLVHHRIGDITVDAPIVLIAVWSAHRAEAFAACQAAMERLKSDIPFWKKETLADGSVRWVEQNSSGVFAAS